MRRELGMSKGKLRLWREDCYGRGGLCHLREFSVAIPHVKSHRKKTHEVGKLSGTSLAMPRGEQQVGQSHFDKKSWNLRKMSRSAHPAEPDLPPGAEPDVPIFHLWLSRQFY